MALRDLADGWQELGCHQRDGYPGALGGGPDPIDGTVRHPGPLVRLIEREPQSKHPRSALPAVDQPAGLRSIQGKIPKYREPVGVRARGLDGQLIRVGVPARWMDQGRV